MKHFTKLFVAITMMLVAISANAKTEQVHATFASPSNTSAQWNAATSSFTWSQTSYNQIRNIGLPTGDLSKYKKLVVDCEIKSGNKFRILFYKGGSNKTLWVSQSGVTEFNIKEELEAIAPDDYNEYILNCDEICLSGSSDGNDIPGEVTINDMYLETYDDEGVKTYATFEAPSNTSAQWNAATSSFTWSQTSYNQIRNIGLPTGDLSKYKKLVVDCEIKSGNKFRILFYKGGSNKTLWVSQSGVTEFNIKEELEAIAPDDYNEYILNCDEICLSGSSDGNDIPGEVVINSVYLETYPENESVEIPEIQYEEDPGKPAGDFVDFAEAFPSLQPRIGLGTDSHPIVLGNGEVIVGQRGQNVIADLSEYTDLTIVTSPNLKLVIYMNHEVAAQQNAGDYAAADEGKYVYLDVQADENGLIKIDLTQFEKKELNCICLPWDNNNKGTVWYLLLTKDDPIFNFNAMNVATSASGDSSGDILEPWYITKGGVTMMVSPAAEGTSTPNRFWSTSNGPQLRMYSGTIVLDAPEGKAITNVEVINGRWHTDNDINDMVGATWEGNSTNVVINIAGNTQMNKIVVTLADANEETTTNEDLPTAITTAKAIVVENEVFNLAGQKLAAPQKGLNIIGGKKVLVK